MLLNTISILNYRSLSTVELELSPKINCFIGRNGVGKTNLLDAVYYLSFCKSAINPADSQHIKHDEPFFMIQGTYLSDNGVREEFSCGLKRGEKKQFKRNKKSYDNTHFIKVTKGDTETDIKNQKYYDRQKRPRVTLVYIRFVIFHNYSVFF